MKKAPIDREELTAYMEQTRGLERDHLGEIVSSRKRAWRIAYFSVALALAGLALWRFDRIQLPPEAFVVRVDNATGTVEQVSRLGEPMEDYGDRIAKYFVNSYILNCEGYSWQTIQEQFNTCALLSSPPIQAQYARKFEGEDDPTKRLKDQGTIDVKVHSITLGVNKTAVARFTLTEREVISGAVQSERHLIATLAYQYINVPLTEAVARRNPLGFQVLRYDIAADLSR